MFRVHSGTACSFAATQTATAAFVLYSPITICKTCSWAILYFIRPMSPIMNGSCAFSGPSDPQTQGGERTRNVRPAERKDASMRRDPEELLSETEPSVTDRKTPRY